MHRDPHFQLLDLLRESPSIITFGHSCSTPTWTAFLHTIASATNAKDTPWWISEQENSPQSTIEETPLIRGKLIKDPVSKLPL
ncbi:Toxin A [Gossypium arboreum]|uniref:Toxin A n=1 Tax=Gossypium arboreum TaxID=29729 RepID=A0A0B0NF65_GOSAR|nr:Toxin A [Gossypium arboreum]